MTSIFIIMSMHSILFLLLYATISRRFSEVYALSAQIYTQVQSIISSRDDDLRAFKAFFRSNVIMKMPDEILAVLTEEHRRWWLSEALAYPEVFNGVTIERCTDIDSLRTEPLTFNVVKGDLIIDGMPASDFFKLLPPIDHNLACSAAFRKWDRHYLQALATQYFKINNA